MKRQKYLTKKIFTDNSLIDYRYVIQNKGNSASEGMYVYALQSAKCKRKQFMQGLHIQKLTEETGQP